MKALFCSVLLVSAVGCGSPAGAPPAVPAVEPPGTAAESSLARITAAAPAADVARVVAGSNDLGFDLLRVAANTTGNTVLSPSSIFLALSMAYAGAAGETRAAFESVLRSGLAEEAHHRAMNDLDRQLTARTDKDLTLRIANQQFAQTGWPMEPAYLETLAREYGASVRLFDFARASEAARKVINGWVSTQTDGVIPELFAPGGLGPTTEFVLVNAILFKGTWESKFDPALTHDAPFTRLDGSSAKVPLMEGTAPAGTAGVLDGVTVAALPYRGGNVSFVVLMPAAGTFSAVEAGLTSARLDAYVAALRSRAYVSLPRFTFGAGQELAPVLGELGLRPAFGEGADYSRLTKNRFTFGSVLHEAVIRVDEEGTVAAAATGVSSGGGMPSQPEHVVVDRPFVFLIRDNATGAVLFVGRVVAP